MPASPLPVIVIGAGIAGVACARRLHDTGQPVRVLERGHRVGGRLSGRSVPVAGPQHPVDLGAPYFTVRDRGFADVLAGWQQAGLAREWTDTFTLSGPGGPTGVTTGPSRWSSVHGLRSLVEALADGLDVQVEREVARVEIDADGVPMVDGGPAAAVVLAMPDPQAERLLTADQARALGVAGRPWSPVLTVWAAWSKRCWPEFDGMYVAGSPVLTWVADSGRSHGDAAAVLVMHSTAELAARHLDDPAQAIGPMLAELANVLGPADPDGPSGLPAPEWARVHRWSFASARETHPEPWILNDQLIGVCGDGWGPQSRVEQAWSSGNGLAGVLLDRLAVP